MSKKLLTDEKYNKLKPPKPDEVFDVLIALRVVRVIARDKDGKQVNINPRSVMNIGKDWIMSDGKALYTDHKSFIKKYQKEKKCP